MNRRDLGLAPPRMIPEDCRVFKQVLDLGRSLGVEPEPAFERALLYFAYQCEVKMWERMQEEMLKPAPPLFLNPDGTLTLTTKPKL